VILSVTGYSFAKKGIDLAGRAEYFTMAIISFIVFIGTRIIKRKLPEIKGRRIGIEYFRSIYIVFMLAMSFILDCFVQDNNFYFNTFVVLYTSVGLYISTLLEEMIIGASIMLMFFIFAFNGLETKVAVLNVFIMLFIIVIQGVASYKNTRDTLVGKAEIDRDLLIKNEYYKNISAQQEQIILMVNEFENYKKVLLEHLRNGNIEELKALVKENNDAVSKETNIDYIEHTGNPVFDAIIYDQRVKFRDYNINVDVRCDIGDLMNNKNFELVSLLGNAFSNAMEACTYVEKESDRYVKVRAKTKLHHGSFPAIWLMPEPPAKPNPVGGEIDIFESFGNYAEAHHTIHTNWTYNLKRTNPTNQFVHKLNVGGWHVYGLEWSPTKLVFMIDGRVTGTYEKSTNPKALEQGQWPFDHPFYIILNQSLRRVGIFGGDPDPGYVYETQFDWVRVYQKQ